MIPPRDKIDGVQPVLRRITSAAIIVYDFPDIVLSCIGLLLIDCIFLLFPIFYSGSSMTEFTVERTAFLGSEVVVFSFQHTADVKFSIFGICIRIRRQRLVRNVERFHQMRCHNDDQLGLFLLKLCLKKCSQNRYFARVKGIFGPTDRTLSLSKVQRSAKLWPSASSIVVDVRRVRIPGDNKTFEQNRSR